MASIFSAYKSSPSPTDRPAFEEHSRVIGNQVFLLDGLSSNRTTTTTYTCALNCITDRLDRSQQSRF